MEPEPHGDAAAGTGGAGRPYRWRWSRDLPLFLRASATNQVARFAPALYTRITGETGRGREAETPESVAAYFQDCVADYRAVLNRVLADDADPVRDATILEYGPGDVPALALAFVGEGARHVYCVDRFPLMRLSDFNRGVLDAVEQRLGDDAARARFREARARLDSVRDRGAIDPEVPVAYLVDGNGHARLNGQADLVLSRAVLEHVNDLAGTFADMFAALRPGGIALHKVDLRSHGLHRETPLDFLTWPAWAWWLMHSSKGTPNRWRVDRYRELAREMGFEVLLLEPVEQFTPEQVAAVRHALAGVARQASADDLTVATFWLAMKKPG